MLSIYTNNINNTSLINFLFGGFDYKILDKNEYSPYDTNYKIGFYYDLINNGFGSSFGHEINDICSKCDIVFLYSNEFTTEHLQMLKLCNDNKNFYYICSAIPYHDLKIKERLIFNGHWFQDNCRIYKKLSYKLNQLNPYINKPYYFDALLGSPKINRQFVYEKITNSNIAQKFILNFGNDASNLFLDDDIAVPKNVNKSYSLDYFDYNGTDTLLCQIIPINVYNQTAYSIVTETNLENRFFFPTEKITKPILSRRLFVVFAQHYYLKYFKSLGFKTFNGIIDESYDNIKNGNERYSAAWEQVKWLCNQDQSKILDKIKWICDYNYNHLTSTDWSSDVRNTVINLVEINI